MARISFSRKNISVSLFGTAGHLRKMLLAILCAQESICSFKYHGENMRADYDCHKVLQNTG